MVCSSTQIVAKALFGGHYNEDHSTWGHTYGGVAGGFFMNEYVFPITFSFFILLLLPFFFFFSSHVILICPFWSARFICKEMLRWRDINFWVATDVYSQTGCSFPRNFANFRRNVGILIGRLL